MTTKKSITDADVTAAKPASELQDGKQGALRLRVSPKGKKVWIAFFWNPQTKKPTRAVLAPADGPGSLTVKEARLAASALVAESAKAVAPKTGAMPVFDDVLVYAKPWVETWFGRYLDDWRHKRLDQITEEMVEDRERQILKIAGDWARLRANKGGLPERANAGATSVTKVGMALRTLYKLAAGKPWLYTGEDMGQFMSWASVKPRKRVFKPAEEKRFFDALESPTLSEWVRPFFLLLYWTGARWGNLKAARWDEIDFDNREWVVPDEKHKNDEQAFKDLTPEAIDILKGMLEKRVDNNPWLFPAAKDPSRHRTDITFPWKAIKKLADLHGITPHDIRRSYGSKLYNNGVPLGVVADMMGHKDPATTATYYTVTSREARRSALKHLSR